MHGETIKLICLQFGELAIDRIYQQYKGCLYYCVIQAFFVGGKRKEVQNIRK